MIKLVLLRHGESIWNLENKFTGWIDVDLSSNGYNEAKNAGKLLKKEGYSFDIAFTSLLKRSQNTLNLCLSEMSLDNIEIVKDWRLNERHYGSLQGLNKNNVVEKYGAEQVMIWRRSYDIPPPQLDKNESTHPIHDLKYSHLSDTILPSAESLKDVVERILPFWNEIIMNELRKKKKVLIVAHGNSLRAIYKILNNISKDDILKFNIPTGVPLVFEFDKKLIPEKNYYLGDKELIRNKIKAVINQTSSSKSKVK